VGAIDDITQLGLLMSEHRERFIHIVFANLEQKVPSQKHAPRTFQVRQRAVFAALQLLLVICGASNPRDVERNVIHMFRDHVELLFNESRLRMLSSWSCVFLQPYLEEEPDLELTDPLDLQIILSVWGIFAHHKNVMSLLSHKHNVMPLVARLQADAITKPVCDTPVSCLALTSVIILDMIKTSEKSDKGVALEVSDLLSNTFASAVGSRGLVIARIARASRALREEMGIDRLTLVQSLLLLVAVERSARGAEFGEFEPPNPYIKWDAVPVITSLLTRMSRCPSLKIPYELFKYSLTFVLACIDAHGEQCIVEALENGLITALLHLSSLQYLEEEQYALLEEFYDKIILQLTRHNAISREQ
jgi:hypothetical protein